MDGAAGLARAGSGFSCSRAFPPVIIGVLVLIILPDGPQDRYVAHSAGARHAGLRGIEHDNAGKRDRGCGHSLMDAFKDGRVWALALVYFALAMCFYAVGFWMPTIIQELGIDKKDLLKSAC
jgi:sugar phosphate permease